MRLQFLKQLTASFAAWPGKWKALIAIAIAIVAVLLFALIQTGYRPEQTEGPIIVIDSDGHVLYDETEKASEETETASENNTEK